MTLALADVNTYYGDSHVLQSVALRVDEGEVVALLGRNGAGKTTTMRSITGLTAPRRGTIRLDGEEIARMPPHRIARSGVAYVPSGRRIFGSLTVRQNLELARRAAHVSDPAWTIERVHETFPKLAELDSRRAGFLSGGEQQMLKLGRALLAHPKLLLLDEPTEGLAPVVVSEMRAWIELIKRDHSTSILLSEQNALFALHLADRGYILEKGRIQHEAPSAELSESQEVRTYLGVQERGMHGRARRPERRGPRSPISGGSSRRRTDDHQWEAEQ
jgi:branched-chain amino acid transport system ATP-binding protein